MDETRIDTVARRLAQASSRRRVLGGGVGGALVLLTASSARADRGGIRKRNYTRSGPDDPVGIEGGLPEGILAGGLWDETLPMCHYDPETSGYRVVPVSTIAVPENLARGDTLYIDCCVDSDCEKRVCLTATACIEGACAYDATVNAPCGLGDGATGICRADGVCVPVSSSAVVEGG